jgi:hypothetical protein
LYACAIEPNDPYSLGFAVEPTQGFVPLWHRADTCREACAAPSSLEMNCREPWEAIAPFIDAGADTGVCEVGSSVPDAGVDAGSDAGESDRVDGGDPVDASNEKPKPTAASRARSSGGCTVTHSARAQTPWWLVPMLMLIGWMRKARRR